MLGPNDEVRVTVIADARPLRERIAGIRRPATIGPLAVVVVGVVVVGVLVAGVLVAGAPGPGAPGRAGRSTARPGAQRVGSPGVAAAFGYPLRCLSVTTATSDRAYARADFNRAASCGRFGWSATPVFRRSDGAWRQVLGATSFSCPVAGVPRAVQSELSICP